MRRVLPALLGLLVALAAPAGAPAATLGVDAQGLAILIADSGESNRLVISESGGMLVFDDAAATIGVVDGEGGCETPDENDPGRASCPLSSVQRLAVEGGDGDDEITLTTARPALVAGGSGDDRLVGGTGDDRLEGGDGEDVVSGGTGDDRVYAVTASRTGAVEADRLGGGIGHDEVVGGAGPDVLNGGDGTDAIEGGGGDDVQDGGEGDDRLSGGDGDDVLAGGAGADRIGSPELTGTAGQSRELGADQALGGPGDDQLYPGPGPGGAPDGDTLDGGDGYDTVSYEDRLTGIRASKDALADDGVAGEGDRVGGDVERLVGGAMADQLVGGDGFDALDGGPGDDRLEGLGGDDQLAGDGASGAGSDVVAGGPGNDVLRGAGGDDALSGGEGQDDLQGDDSADVLDGGPGPDVLDGGAGTDTAAFAETGGVTVALASTSQSAAGGEVDQLRGMENGSGSAAADTMTGTPEANVVDSGGGEDYLDGGGGGDRLLGGDGPDVVAARDRARDGQVACGPGVDVAIVDPSDRPVRRGPDRCERVQDGRRDRPRAGREVLAEPTGCARQQVRWPTMTRLVPLDDDVLVPAGRPRRTRAHFDLSGCAVDLTARGRRRGRSGTAVVSGGEFTVTQQRRRGPAVDLVMAPVAPCSTGARMTRADAPLRVRRRRGGGRWRTIGGYSNAASYSTAWVTTNRCDRTITRVLAGHVRVYDKVRRVTVDLRKGETYVAGPGGR